MLCGKGFPNTIRCAFIRTYATAWLCLLGKTSLPSNWEAICMELSCWFSERLPWLATLYLILWANSRGKVGRGGEGMVVKFP